MKNWIGSLIISMVQTTATYGAPALFKDAVLTIDLVKDANLKFPRFTTAGPVTRHLDVKGYEVTTGIGPDPLVLCAQVMTPFELTMPLDVTGLSLGNYRVVVNDQEIDFDLE